MTRYDTVGKHATVIGADQTHRFVQYHATQVVRWNEDEIILNTGGWETVTTKVRMNQVSRLFDLKFQVYQQKGQWYAFYKEKDFPFEGNKVTLTRREKIQEQLSMELV